MTPGCGYRGGDEGGQHLAASLGPAMTSSRTTKREREKTPSTLAASPPPAAVSSPPTIQQQPRSYNSTRNLRFNSYLFFTPCNQNLEKSKCASRHLTRSLSVLLFLSSFISTRVIKSYLIFFYRETHPVRRGRGSQIPLTQG